MNAALLSSKNMCWCTPQDFFDKLNAEFGFVLDPAATDKTAKCSLYYTPETDGLSQSWDRGGAVFCNPPYGREIGKWVQKAFEEARGGIRLFYLSQRGQTQHIFTITFTGKRKSASCAGGIECIDALEAATSGLQGIEAFCTANAIKYLWRWKLKNGEEDLQKAVWYINRLIQRAGADSAAGKELFNMKENKHGFEPKQEFTMGGIAWTVIQTGADWVKCIASDCVEERAFDEGNKNDFAASSLRAYLNGEFLRRLIKAGAPEEMFEYFNIDLTADDGLKNYGGDRVRIGLITCEEYRLLRGNIPALPDRWWWTATPDSPINSFVRIVHSDGSLYYYNAYGGSYGVRPLCNLKSEILVSYLNGENAEEQKKRAEAVDMMKHIAAAWDIDAEEVFGRADE